MQYIKPNIFGSKNILNNIVGSNMFTPNVGTLKVYPTWVYRLAIDALGKAMTYRMEDVQLVVYCWRGGGEGGNNLSTTKIKVQKIQRGQKAPYNGSTIIP
jgi:hypothetical protein